MSPLPQSLDSPMSRGARDHAPGISVVVPVYRSEAILPELVRRLGEVLPTLADNYELQGRHKDAVRMFERLLEIRNDVGLLSEEYDPVAKRQLGNFPQAFSHVGLVNTAFNLTGRSKGPAANPSAAVDSR